MSFALSNDNKGFEAKRMCMGDELDLSSDEKGDAKADQKGGSKLIIIIIAIVVLVAAGGGAWFMLGGDKEEKAEVPKEVPKETKKEAVYIPFGSEFVVNIGDKEPKHLVIKMTVMTRDDETAAAIKKHKPLLRSSLIEMLEVQDYGKLQTVDGKVQLRKESLETIKTILEKQSEKNKIEAVLFTNFMMD